MNKKNKEVKSHRKKINFLPHYFSLSRLLSFAFFFINFHFMLFSFLCIINSLASNFFFSMYFHTITTTTTKTKTKEERITNYNYYYYEFFVRFILLFSLLLLLLHISPGNALGNLVQFFPHCVVVVAIIIFQTKNNNNKRRHAFFLSAFSNE